MLPLVSSMTTTLIGCGLLSNDVSVRADDKFAGYPPIGKTAKREKSTKVIASDPVQGLQRPKWTRAMNDGGSGVNMFRFKGDIYFVHSAVDGHRGAAPELKDKRFIHVSKDEGKTWTPMPQPKGANFGKYVTPAGRCSHASATASSMRRLTRVHQPGALSPVRPTRVPLAIGSD